MTHGIDEMIEMLTAGRLNENTIYLNANATEQTSAGIRRDRILSVPYILIGDADTARRDLSSAAEKMADILEHHPRAILGSAKIEVIAESTQWNNYTLIAKKPAAPRRDI